MFIRTTISLERPVPPRGKELAFMSGAAEMGQGEGTLTRAAGLVAEAKQDFDAMSKTLDGQIAGIQGKWAGAGGTAFLALHQAWTEKQRVITAALNEFEASLTSTEKDNVNTDQTQSSNYSRVAGRLG
jgi:ESAT-6 family protein